MELDQPQTSPLRNFSKHEQKRVAQKVWTFSKAKQIFLWMACLTKKIERESLIFAVGALPGEGERGRSSNNLNYPHYPNYPNSPNVLLKLSSCPDNLGYK